MQCWAFWKWFRERLFIHGSGFLYVKGLWLMCQARTTKPPRSFPWKITVEEFRAKKMQALGTIPSLLWDNPLYIFLKQFFFFFDWGSVQFRSVQSLSRVWLFATPWITARQASLSINNSWSLFKLMSIESVMPSSHLILCCPLLLLPPIAPSIRIFSNESTLCMRGPKYWSFSFSISPSNDWRLERDKSKTSIYTEFRICSHIYPCPTFLEHPILLTG